MIIPPGYAHIQHFFGGSAAPNGAAVTYGIGGFGFADPESAAVQMHLTFGLTIMPHLALDLQLQETRAKFGPNSTGPFGLHTENISGGVSGGTFPPQVAFLVEKRTAAGGRSGRGRLYLPGIIETLADNGGNIALAVLTGWEGILDDWLADIEAVSTGMFLLHTASSDPTKVTKLSLDPKVATQRRRLR